MKMAIFGHFFESNKLKKRSQKNLNKEDVSNQARLLFTNFVKDKLNEEQIPGKENVENILESVTPIGPPIEHYLVVPIGKALKSIGDELGMDEKMHNLIAKVPARAEHDTLMRVAGEIFSDGEINWGRIVVVFYFAYRLILKSLYHIPFIQTTINFMVDYIRDHLATWIISQGGWESIVEYYGTPTIQAALVLGAGIILSAIIYFKKH